jgi:hypothetical protein
MKKALAGLVLMASIWAPCQVVPRYVTMNGHPDNTLTATLHVGGELYAARLIVIEYHEMGCLIQDFCPVGLKVFFWMQDGKDTANCSAWYRKVLLIDKNKDPYTGPYAYLEMVFDTTKFQSILTDEGIYLSPAGAVKCNGSLDWTGMLL